MGDVVERVERTFLVNFWNGTHGTSCRNEDELRALATKLAAERRTVVGFYEVVDGKAVRLGAVSGIEVEEKRGRVDAKPTPDVELSGAEASVERTATSYAKVPTSFWDAVSDD